jgi:magnesium-transporting ATPase (P-type)
MHCQPFDPVHNRTEATVRGGDGNQFFVAKGAPQVILQMSKNADAVSPRSKRPWMNSPCAASAHWASAAPTRRVSAQTLPPGTPLPQAQLKKIGQVLNEAHKHITAVSKALLEPAP